MKRVHRMPFGAELVEPGSARFRLWAPAAREIALVIAPGRPDESRLDMPPLGDGWWERVAPAPAATRYRYLVDGKRAVPDPASRFNPDDVHGASEVVDPEAFQWEDGGWRGRPWEEATIYELHVGTFSPAGTFAGVEARLDYLSELGVTALELMPVADFPGRRGWGYDGVLPFAPDAAYGRPEGPQAPDRRGARARSHGPARRRLQPLRTGRQLPASLRAAVLHGTPSHAVGRGLQFRRRRASRPVRDFFVHNALYWLEEFHADGLRFDAVHAIADDSRPDILEELAAAIRNGPGRSRHVHLVLENDANQARYLRRATDGGAPLYDAQWNDDVAPCFSRHAHRRIRRLLRRLRSASRRGSSDARSRRASRTRASPRGIARGERAGSGARHLPPAAFVSFLQTHDQVGNRAFGERLAALAEEPALRAATVAWLLAPAPPMLFMGEEFGAATPFLYFCDFDGELAAAVRDGRRREFAQFARFADARARDRDTGSERSRHIRPQQARLDIDRAPAARALACALPAAARAAPAMARAAARRHDGIRGALRGAGCRRARVPNGSSETALSCASGSISLRAKLAVAAPPAGALDRLRAGRRGARAGRAAFASLLRCSVSSRRTDGR